MRANPFVRRILVVLLITAIMATFCGEPFPCRAQEVVLGDVNGDGDITSVDASMALQIANGILAPTADQHSAADADQDGSVTSADAEMILKCAAEKCSAFTRKTIGPGGGVLEADDLTITIPPGAFSEEATIAVKTIDPYPIQYENLDALGSFYQLEHFPQIHEPITLEISFDPSAIATEDSVYIYQEQLSFIEEGGGVAQSGRPRLDTEVDKINGTATIQIAPYETNPTAVISNNLINTSEQQGSYLSNDIPSYWGAGGVTAAKNFTEVKDKDNYFHIIDYTESESEARLKEILKFFIEAKNKLESESLGFSLDEGKKLPVEVYITNNLISSGVNVPAEAVRPDTTPWHAYWMAYYSYINMKPGYSDAEYQVITGHELFHIVQYVYGAYSFLDEEYGGYQYGWLNDGSSTWFEAKLSPLGKNYFSGKARTNSNFIYSPLEIDDGDKGYGASSFLTYLTDQSGYGDKLIYTIYEKIKNGEDNDTGTGALQAALGSSDTLSALFSEFAFKFISKTTGYANWPEPSPPPGGEFTIYPDAPPHISTLNPSALSAWNVKVNLPSGTIPSETYKLVVSLEGGNTFIDGAVYTRDTASSNWQSACEITPDGTCEIAQFYGNGKRLSANIILVNHQAEHPYDQDVPLTLTIEIKEVIKSIMGTWDVTKYDYLCQGFWSQTGELHIFDNGTYTMDLEESERGIADFAGTWELKQEPHITDNPRAYFYSNDVLQFIGTVNETYNEISCDPCIMPASIIVCMRANKILDTP